MAPGKVILTSVFLIDRRFSEVIAAVDDQVRLTNTLHLNFAIAITSQIVDTVIIRRSGLAVGFGVESLTMLRISAIRVHYFAIAFLIGFESLTRISGKCAVVDS